MTAQTTSLEQAPTSVAWDLTGATGRLGVGYRAVRSVTRSIAERTSAEDQMVQSSSDASPMKWHQAHTTWFFETFVLRPFLPDYKPFREEFRWLFNSYYNSIGGAVPEKQLRASFSRPSLRGGPCLSGTCGRCDGKALRWPHSRRRGATDHVRPEPRAATPGINADRY